MIYCAILDSWADRNDVMQRTSAEMLLSMRLTTEPYRVEDPARSPELHSKRGQSKT